METGEGKINSLDWNRFVFEQGGSFLQSFEWGEFQKSIGREVFYLKDAKWQAMTIKYEMPLGRNYLFCPHGPVLAQNIQTCGFLEALQDLARKEKSVFLRIESCAYSPKEVLSQSGFIKSKDIEPAKTLVLDLNLSEEELLGEMHEKTRYNIGLAQRKGVKIRTSDNNDDDFDVFWDLLNQTAKKQKIRLFDKEYYRKQSAVNSQQFKNLIFIAFYQNKPIAANMVNIYVQAATYVHGGSDNEYRNLMAPHLLQWEQIKYAKAQGCMIYDFYGCDEDKWPGVSRFKKGFGGREISYCGTHDYVFNKLWYKIYKAGRRIIR